VSHLRQEDAAEVVVEDAPANPRGEEDVRVRQVRKEVFAEGSAASTRPQTQRRQIEVRVLRQAYQTEVVLADAHQDVPHKRGEAHVRVLQSAVLEEVRFGQAQDQAARVGAQFAGDPERLIDLYFVINKLFGLNDNSVSSVKV
jgi:hypothetical protein